MVKVAWASAGPGMRTPAGRGVRVPARRPVLGSTDPVPGVGAGVAGVVAGAVEGIVAGAVAGAWEESGSLTEMAVTGRLSVVGALVASEPTAPPEGTVVEVAEAAASGAPPPPHPATEMTATTATANLVVIFTAHVSLVRPSILGVVDGR